MTKGIYWLDIKRQNDKKKQVLKSKTILFVFNSTMHVVLTGNFGKETHEKRKSNLN